VPVVVPLLVPVLLPDPLVVPPLPEVAEPPELDAEVAADVEPDPPEAPQALSITLNNDIRTSGQRHIVVLIISRGE
jgi:hypothetical protein